MHRRLTGLVLSSALVLTPVAALAMSGPAASASTVSPRAHALAQARAFLKKLVVGQHGTDHAVVSRPGAQIQALRQFQSTNWSGYADDNTAGNTYSKITAHWSEPAVTCSSATTLAVFWVGIDGFTSGSVEQDGTLAECFGGSAFYFTWWEMFPTNSVQVVGQNVRPGDSISASVVRTGTSYALAVTDSTTGGNTFSTTQSCRNCANSSAEWIAEAPSGSGGIEPLADFHSWTASSATVTSGSTNGVISTFPDDELTMVNGSGQVKAQPGPLNGSGNGFTVTWERSS